MERYVLGFCFLPNWDCVLIEKTKPTWQKGLVNGLGGSIESGETLHDAMVREFKEECGISTHTKQWQHCVTFGNNHYELNVFRGMIQHAHDLTRSCDEGIVELYKSPPDNMEQTALWLYWMCRDNSTIGLLSPSPQNRLERKYSYTEMMEKFFPNLKTNNNRVE